MKKETCRDCAALVADEAGNWICDELDMAIDEIDNECPEGLQDLFQFDIFITDLNDNARKQLEQIIGTEHNYDILPLVTLELMEGENK
jgi:hypothetical protein